MTPAEAEQHIILSRQTLSRYVPEKAQKLASLISEWVAFRERLKAKLH